MTSRKCIDRYRGKTLPGIDVSRHQGTIDWKRVARAGLYFAFIRASDSTAVIDAKFERNWRGALDIGLRRGAYIYWRATDDPIAQAEVVLSQIASAGGLTRCDMPPCVDLEEAGQGELAIQVVLEKMRTTLDHLEKHLARIPLIYTGQYWHWKVSQQHPELASAFKRYPLWVPSYNTTCPLMPVAGNGTPSPWAQWTFHQYSSDGQIDGIPGRVDLNRFRGDETTFKRFVQASRKPSLGEALINATPFGAALLDGDC